MGLSFRPPTNFDSIRLNASTNRVGASTGVRGARVSIGPRGTYVTLSRGGFQYRHKFASDPRSPAAPAPSSSKAPLEGFIHTASVDDLRECSPESSLDEIQSPLGRSPLFPWYMAASLALMCFGAVGAFFGLVCLVLGIFVYRWDRERRTARIFYDVDDSELLARLVLANAVGESLSSAAQLWHLFYAESTSDWKRNAGAGKLVQRTPLTGSPGARASRSCTTRA